MRKVLLVQGPSNLHKLATNIQNAIFMLQHKTSLFWTFEVCSKYHKNAEWTIFFDLKNKFYRNKARPEKETTWKMQQFRKGQAGCHSSAENHTFGYTIAIHVQTGPRTSMSSYGPGHWWNPEEFSGSSLGMIALQRASSREKDLNFITNFECRQVLYCNLTAVMSDISDLKDGIVIKLEAYKIAGRTI